MFKALFNIMLNMVASIIQIIVWPINQLITTTLPDISEKILQVTNVFSTIFDCITWGLGLFPNSVLAVLLFILSVEIAKHTIFKSTHMLLKVWNTFQKIKFW